MAMSALEKKAHALAAAQFLSGEPGLDWYEVYEHLVECVEQGDELDQAQVWAPFEHMSLDTVLSHVETAADAIYASFKEVLEMAKDGIVAAAFEDELDPNMSALDMEDMVEKGATVSGA